MEQEPMMREKFWRRLLVFWSVVAYAVIIYDFLKPEAVQYILGPVLALYTVVLAIYAGTKEFERWHDFHASRHPGEIFVILWTVIVFGVMLAGLVFDKPYRLSSQIISTYIAVVGILAITRKSKSLYNAYRKKR